MLQVIIVFGFWRPDRLLPNVVHVVGIETLVRRKIDVLILHAESTLILNLMHGYPVKRDFFRGHTLVGAPELDSWGAPVPKSDLEIFFCGHAIDCIYVLLAIF